MAERLPRGRHTLTRDEVASDQRARLMLALAEVMGEKGFAATSVADVVRRAGVSRQTFYEQFDGLLPCFLATFDVAGDLLVDQLAADAGGPDEAPIERFSRLLRRYLDVLADWSPQARVLLVECHAAGAEGIGRRAALQARIASALEELFAVDDDRGRFACAALVAAVASLVTEPLVRDDRAALLALHGPIVDLVAVALDRRLGGP